jgi:Tir chaperone family protein CesT
MAMITREDLESFLIRMDMEWEEVEEGMFLVRSKDGGIPVVVHHTDPVLLLRLKVMDLPEGGGHESFYRTLLEFNATDIVHGAYGIEENELILSDTLELATLDFEELQASVESLQYAVSSHVSQIRELAGVVQSGDAGEEEAEG